MNTRIKGPVGGAVDAAGRSGTIDRAKTAAGARPTASPSPEGVESVHITSAAHQMLALQQHIDETPDIDVARVEQLRDDISQNRYQIDASRITDRLLQLEGDLQASTKKAGTGP